MIRFKHAAFFLGAAALLQSSVSFCEPSRQAATVDAVLTGDTVRLKGGKTLKYIGLEAYSPESKTPLTREYGTRAQELNNKLVGGKKIGIEWGPKLRDKQGRLLGYVFTEDGTFVNEELLREGLAKTRILVPNVRYADEFRDWENGAKRDRKGIWANEPPDPNANKRIVGEKNTKIYYYPDSPELAKIPEAQLVRFSSRVDAKAAGYTPCFSCRQKGQLDETE